MALEEMLTALEKEGEEDVKKILSQSEAHKNQIIKEATDEASKIREAYRKKIEDQVRIDRSKILNKASFHIKKEIIRAKEAMMNEVFNQVVKQVGSLRNESSYEGILEKLAQETINAIPGKPVISIDSADEQLARKILDKMEVDYSLEKNAKCLGGLKATSEDGRIILNNTIDSRVDKAKQLLKTDVLRVLFGEN